MSVSVGHLYSRFTGRRTPERDVCAFAALLSILFYAWYAQRGLTMAFADAISHFMIARQVMVGRTPGLGQLGGDWLPLPHLLMLPLIWIDMLWRDGFAGSLPSMVAYVIGSVYMYRLGYLLFSSRIGGMTAALAYMLNPSMLYMQATAMTEASLNAALIASAYYAVCWAQTNSAINLVKAALAVAAGTAIRYDGWAVAIAMALIVVYIAWRRGGRAHAEAHVLLYGALGFAGCAAWLLYNQVIFGNALKFLLGSTSAQGQAQRQPSPTKHHPLLSLHLYSQAAVDTFWWPLTLAALCGLVYWIIRHRVELPTAPVYVLLVPFAFNWASMVLGISGMRIPGITLGVGNDVFFNLRLVLVMMPAVALFLAFLAVQRRELLVVLLTLIVLFAGFGSFYRTPYVLEDPLHGIGGSLHFRAEGQWLAKNYRGGNVLISGAPFEPTIFYSSLPQSIFVTDADSVRFPAALAQPQSWVRWIVMDRNSANYDAVWGTLSTRHDWRRYFVLRHVAGTAQFFERGANGRIVASAGDACRERTRRTHTTPDCGGPAAAVVPVSR